MKNANLNSIKMSVKRLLGLELDESATEAELADSLEQFNLDTDGFVTKASLEGIVADLYSAIGANTDKFKEILSGEEVIEMVASEKYDDSDIKEELTKVGQKLLALTSGEAQATSDAPSSIDPEPIVNAAKGWQSKQKTLY